jgi:hypothetical protein
MWRGTLVTAGHFARVEALMIWLRWPLACLLIAGAGAAYADGFRIYVQAGKLFAECEDAIVIDDRLHNGNLSPDRDLAGAVALIGGGLNPPSDTFSMEIIGPLWYSAGSTAVLPDPNITMIADSYSTIAHTTLLGTTTITSLTTGSATQPLMIDNSDNQIWSIPQGHIAAGVYGVQIVIHGLQNGDPQTPFEPTDPLVFTFRTPGFGNSNAAMLRDARTAVFDAALAGYHPLAGDFNADGTVDGSDFAIWQENFPLDSGAALGDGDADGDGDIDGADFIVWQTNYGAGGPQEVAAVPEPAAWILALLAAGTLTALRQTRD